VDIPFISFFGKYISNISVVSRICGFGGKTVEPFSEKIKLIYIVLLRFVRKIFFILPVKQNRVIFESFSGDGYQCNPKYISERLKEKYGGSVEVVWALKDENKAPRNVIVCKYRSIRHFIYRITSKVYVCNFFQVVEIPKRKGQAEIQTWHGGGCYKKVGTEEKELGSAYIMRRDMHVAETDYFIVSSKYWEEQVAIKQFGYKGKVLEIGMPRNDCLVEKTDKSRIMEIRKKAGIDESAYAVLYAPTWREGLDQFEAIDYESLEMAYKKRFGRKCQILFRAHLYGKEKLNNVIDLTTYEDMQELLYACDSVITDYSSLMWDFCLTEKPCFLYTPDLKRYTEQRGFDMDIYTWGFPVCESNDELVNAILGFDEVDFRNKMKKHREVLGSFETGKATEGIVKLIAKICKLSL